MDDVRSQLTAEADRVQNKRHEKGNRFKYLPRASPELGENGIGR
jgi:hypothetical protein